MYFVVFTIAVFKVIHRKHKMFAHLKLNQIKLAVQHFSKDCYTFVAFTITVFKIIHKNLAMFEQLKFTQIKFIVRYFQN